MRNRRLALCRNVQVQIIRKYVDKEEKRGSLLAMDVKTKQIDDKQIATTVGIFLKKKIKKVGTLHRLMHIANNDTMHNILNKTSKRTVEKLMINSFILPTKLTNVLSFPACRQQLIYG